MSNNNYSGHPPGGSASGPSYYPWNDQKPALNMEDHRPVPSPHLPEASPDPRAFSQQPSPFQPPTAERPQYAMPPSQGVSGPNQPQPAYQGQYQSYPMAAWINQPPYDYTRTRPPESLPHYPSQGLSPNPQGHGPYATSGYRPPTRSYSASSDTGPQYTVSSGYTPVTVPSVVSAPAGLPKDYHPDPGNPMMLGRRHVPRSEGSVPVSLSEEQQSTASTSRGPGQKYIPQKCPHCDEVPRCKSDYKKHVQKHEKPYKCKVTGCRREGGFTTPNDLARHMKSVHKIGGSTKSYRCAARICKSKSKVWPRLDNFKQHCSRMHKEEDQGLLITQSEFTPSPLPESTPQLVKEPPVDALIAGMGGGSKNLTSHYGNPTGNMSLTPDRQPGTSWEEGYGVEQPVYGQGEDQQQGTDSLPYSLGLPATDLPGTGQNLSGADDSVQIDPALIGHSQVAMMARDLSNEAMLAETSSTDGHLDLEQFRMSHAHGLVDGAPVFSPLANPHTHPQDDALGILSDCIAHGNSRKVLRALTAAKLDIGHYRPSSDNSVASDRSADQAWTKSRPGTAREESPDVEMSPPSDDELDDRQSAIEPKDIMKAMNAILKLLHEKKKPGKSATRAESESSPSKGLECPTCKKVMSRSCELNKHMKRHTRPFGCTFPRCNKKFGSKNDWKRHENGQHFQLDNWRCEMITNGAKCGQLFFNPEFFKQHLHAEHRLDQKGKQVEEELKIRCIGKNCQGRFWCGFCQEIVELKHREEKAWDERFDHIEREHFRRGQNIKDWLCVETNRPKGEVEKTMNRRNFTSDVVPDEHTSPGDTSQEDRGPPLPSHRPSGSGAPPPATASPVDLSATPTLGNPLSSRKRKFQESYCSGLGTATTPDIDFFCCRCQTAACMSKLYPSCLSCSHIFCHLCLYKIPKVSPV